MKPFPTNTGITLAPDLVSERPWWTQIGDSERAQPVMFHRWDGWLIEEVPGKSAQEKMAEIDQKHPIVEPRFRSGQVWLFNAAQVAVTATLDIAIWPPAPGQNQGSMTWEPDDPFAAFGLPLHRQPRRDPYEPGGLGGGFVPQQFGYILMGRVLSQMEGQDLLRSAHPLWDAYLIFDPCNPRGGIWTGARE
jgi:hypothetical protein